MSRFAIFIAVVSLSVANSLALSCVEAVGIMNSVNRNGFVMDSTFIRGNYMDQGWDTLSYKYIWNGYQLEGYREKQSAITKYVHEIDEIIGIDYERYYNYREGDTATIEDILYIDGYIFANSYYKLALNYTWSKRLEMFDAFNQVAYERTCRLSTDTLYCTEQVTNDSVLSRFSNDIYVNESENTCFAYNILTGTRYNGLYRIENISDQAFVLKLESSIREETRYFKKVRINSKVISNRSINEKMLYKFNNVYDLLGRKYLIE